MNIPNKLDDLDKLKTDVLQSFCSFGVEQLNLISPYTDAKIVSKGDTILAKGQIARYVYVICDGLLRQHVIHNKKDVTQKFYVEGDVIISADSLFSEEPSDINISALTECVCVTFDFDKIIKLSEKSLEVAAFVQKILKSSLLLEQSKCDDRLYSSAKDRYIHFCKTYPVVSLQVNVSYIASYLNMAPETLSRLRSTTLIDYDISKDKKQTF